MSNHQRARHPKINQHLLSLFNKTLCKILKKVRNRSKNLLKKQKNQSRRHLKSIVIMRCLSATSVLRRQKSQLSLDVDICIAGLVSTLGWISLEKRWYAQSARVVFQQRVSYPSTQGKITRTQGKIEWKKLIDMYRKKNTNTNIPGRPQGERSEAQG